MLPSNTRDQAFKPWFAKRYRRGLTVLYEHYLFAENESQCPAAYSVSIQRLRDARMEDVALQWLMSRAYILLIAGGGNPLSSSDGAQRRDPPQFQDDSFFALTKSGFAFVVESNRPPLPMLSDSGGGTQDAGIDRSFPDIPVISWDAEEGVLRVDGAEVRRVRRDATFLRRILDAFPRAGWQARISDPLPAEARTDAKKRLRNAVERHSLNKGMHRNAVEFHTCEEGNGVRWNRLAAT